MNTQASEILQAIEHFKVTGEVGEALFPGFNQNGEWIGMWDSQGFAILALEMEGKSTDPSKFSYKDAEGKMHLLSSYQDLGKNPEIKYTSIAGNVLLPNATTLNLENLREIGGSLETNAEVVCLPKLGKIGKSLDLPKAQRLNFDSLKEIGGSIDTPMTSTLGLPKLRQVGGYIRADRATHVLCPSLKSIGGFASFHTAEAASAPKLEEVGKTFEMASIQAIELPSLRFVGGRLCLPQSKKLVIPKLQEVGADLDASSANDFHAPELLVVGGVLSISHAKELSARKLTFVGGTLDGSQSKTIVLPKLEEIEGSLLLQKAEILFLPQLQKTKGSFEARESKEIRAPKLQEIGGKLLTKRSHLISLPNLTMIKELNIGCHKHLEIPLLRIVRSTLCIEDLKEFFAPSLEKVGKDIIAINTPHLVVPVLAYIGGGLAGRETTTIKAPKLREIKGSLDIPRCEKEDIKRILQRLNPQSLALLLSKSKGNKPLEGLIKKVKVTRKVQKAIDHQSLELS